MPSCIGLLLLDPFSSAEEPPGGEGGAPSCAINSKYSFIVGRFVSVCHSSSNILRSEQNKQETKKIKK